MAFLNNAGVERLWSKITAKIDEIKNLVGDTAVSTQITNTTNSFIKGLSVSGQTVTYTKGDGSTGTITTQDTNTDTKVSMTTTNPTSYTGYYVPFSNSQSNTGTGLLANNGIRYYTNNGTSDAVGYGELCLGNSTASGTAGNKLGRMSLYGYDNHYVTITPANTTSNISLTLPSSSGTLALASDLTDGTAVNYTGNSDSDETALNTWLTEQLNTMSNKSAKFISYCVYPAISGHTYFGVLYRYSASYATVFLNSYDKSLAIKIYSNGTWLDTYRYYNNNGDILLPTGGTSYGSTLPTAGTPGRVFFLTT